jgi:hypothetical protein
MVSAFELLKRMSVREGSADEEPPAGSDIK